MISKSNKTDLSRRLFLQTSGLAAGGLIIGFYLPSVGQKALAQEGAPAAKPIEAPNAFVQISPDNQITIVINKLEMGQGVNTSMAQLIAEELGCDWKQIRSVSAPVNPVYNHTVFAGMQMTGGSSALSSSWLQHRRIGAALREMLKSAAAAKWQVPVQELKVENSFVIHPKKGKLSFGELAEAANRLPLPQDPPLKKEKDFKIIGQSVHRVDAAGKVNGEAVFGLDVQIPNMQYAMILRPPSPGMKIKSLDPKTAKSSPGVTDVIRFGDKVAVLAKNTHAARVGRDALKVEWDEKGKTAFSDESLMQDFRKQAAGKGPAAANRGNVDQLLKESTNNLKAEYEFPFLAHAPMEPMNCTIHFDGKTAEIWSGHQMPTSDRGAAAAILGLAPEKVTVNTVYAGGSFGRRANKISDYTSEACELAKVAKRPLKVVWSREDDMQGGFYRPMTFHSVNIGLDKSKKFLCWDHQIVGQSVIGGSMFEQFMVKDGLESTITEGVSDTAYDFANFRCHQVRAQTPITTLWWRSVGHTHTAYVMETMLDELAEATNQDPLKLRRSLLQKSPRHIEVLDLLAKQTGWAKKKVPQGRAWGLAIHESFGTVVGQIAEVSLSGGTPKVHKVWCAVHCGQVVNPEGAKTQVEGAIAYGLSAALHGEIKIENGIITTSNFHNYPVMRLPEMPEVSVSFVKTTQPPTGLGEPGLPPIAPAVANAIYRLTHQRLRKLPFSRELKA